MTLEEAISNCKIKGGILYESQDRSINNKVKDIAYNLLGDSLVWLGIGKSNADENFYFASNNESLLWENWNQSSDPRGDCVLMSTDNGKWIDVNCIEETQQAICVSNIPVNGDAAILDGKHLFTITEPLSIDINCC